MYVSRCSLTLLLVASLGVSVAAVDTTAQVPSISSTSIPQNGSTVAPTTPAPPRPTPDTNPWPCNNKPAVDDSGPSLPKLNEEFVVGVEATILQKHTSQVVMYHSKRRNKAVMVVTENGRESTIIYNFETLQMFVINDKQCETSDIKNGRNEWFPFFNYTSKGGHGYIGSAADVLKFGSEYNETYLSTAEVRGIPVDHWTACIQWNGATCSMDYYFTKDGYPSAAGMKPVPVRAVIKGQHLVNEDSKMANFSHTYEFMFYKPGDIKDDSLFEIPPGVVCQGVTTEKHQPDIPDHFSLMLEVVDRGNQFLRMAQIYYDLSANLSRFDEKPSKKENSDMGKIYGYRPLKVIHDFSTGLQYVIDKMKENCTVQMISGNETDAQLSTTDPNHVVMRHAAVTLLLKKINFTYQGVRNFRDIPVNVWAGVDNSSGTYEAYFLTKDGNWSSEVGEKADEKQVLLGVWSSRVLLPGQKPHEVMYNYYNFEEDPPDISAFDISMCFDEMAQMKHVMFRMPGQYDELVAGRHQTIQRAVRKAAAKASGIPEIRIHDIYFDQTSNDYIDVWLTILNKPHLAGLKEVDSVDLETAYNNLKSAVDSKKLTISINQGKDTGSKEVTAKPDSLTTSKEAIDPRQPMPTCTVNKGHSNGSMAAVGIFMVIVGAVLGVGVLFVLRKRVTGIPYQLQD